MFMDYSVNIEITNLSSTFINFINLNSDNFSCIVNLMLYIFYVIYILCYIFYDIYSMIYIL